MKVLLLNGSPKPNGSTYTALSAVASELNDAHIETEIFHVGSDAIRGCTGCGHCGRTGSNKCIFVDDRVNQFIEKAFESDGFIFGSPVHYASASGAITSFLDRCFFAGKNAFVYKPGAAIVALRRAGSTAALDQLNKYLTISNMPLVSSQYWNMVHGSNPEQVKEDMEGMQTMRYVGKNMAWLLKCIEAGKSAGIELPEQETREWTNFIR